MDEFEKRLTERLGEEYEKAVKKKIDEFGGLLTKNTAIRLLCKEYGIEIERRVSICEALKTSFPFSFRAKIERIFPIQKYENNLKSVRLHVSDETGSATLMLWNDRVKLVNGEISIGDIIEVRGAYLRAGEIGVGKNGAIKRETAFPVSPVSKLTYGVCSVEGLVKEIEPDYYYIDKKTGKEKKMTSFLLCEENNYRRVVVWSEGEKPKVGDVVLLENVFFKSGEIHFDRFSRMVKKSSVSESFGEFGGVSIEGENVSFLIDEKRLVVDPKHALQLLHIHAVPEGVTPQTLIKIKSSEIEGKTVKYTIEDGRIALFEIS